MVKRGVTFIVLLVLLSSLASAGLLDSFKGGLFTGVWNEYLTGSVVQGERIINYIRPEGGIIDSNPIYLEVSTLKNAKCYYYFKLSGSTGFSYFQLFKLTGESYHYTSTELKDNNYEMSIKCSDLSGNTETRNYFVSVKTNGKIVYRSEPAKQVVEEPKIEDAAEEKPEFVCEGCSFDSACLKKGNIAGDYYCDGELKPRLKNKEICNFEYECLSGVCMNNKCGKQDAFERVLAYFKALFKKQ